MNEAWRNEPVTAGDMFEFYEAKAVLKDNHMVISPRAAAIWIKDNAEAKVKFRKGIAIAQEKAFPWPGNDT